MGHTSFTGLCMGGPADGEGVGAFPGLLSKHPTKKVGLRIDGHDSRDRLDRVLPLEGRAVPPPTLHQVDRYDDFPRSKRLQQQPSFSPAFASTLTHGLTVLPGRTGFYVCGRVDANQSNAPPNTDINVY